MMDYLSELTVREYFFHEAIWGEALKDQRQLFASLGRAMLLSERRIDELFEMIKSGSVADVQSESDYNLYCRTRQYCDIMNLNATPVSETQQELIHLKGGVYGQLKDLGFSRNKMRNPALVREWLLLIVNVGSIAAIRALGWLQMTGIMMDHNREEGLKNLRAAAQWNDTVGLLGALGCDEENRAAYLSRLKIALENGAQAETYAVVRQRYGEERAKDAGETRLLEKAFRLGVLRRDRYDIQYARVLYSAMLDENDKEKAILSADKGTISMLAELPLTLALKDVEYDANALKQTVLYRETETKKIANILGNGDLRQKEYYRPVCICSGSSYAIDSYVEALKNYAYGSKVTVIEVAELTENDFAPAKSNVFVRSCDEDEDNVYVLIFRGDIRESLLEGARTFLRNATRRNFRLSSPCATLDLGAVMTICLCDHNHVATLKNYCDVVKVAEVSKEERADVIGRLLAEKSEQYAVPAIYADEDALSVLQPFGIDRIERILDRAVRINRVRGCALTLTKEQLRESLEEGGADRNPFGFTYGFGGMTIND